MIEKINNESVTNIISKCKRFDLKNKKTIAAIVAIIGIIFIFVTINGVLICRQHNAIKAVKKSHLEGYSKTVQEAFNDTFGKSKVKWKYHSKGTDKKGVYATVSNADIYLGKNAKKKNINIGYMDIVFDYDFKSKTVNDVSCIGAVIFDDDDATSISADYNDENNNVCKVIINGIFKENLSIYQKAIEQHNAYNSTADQKTQQAKNILADLKNNATDDCIRKAKKYCIENGLYSETEAQKASVKDVKKLLQAYIDARSQNTGDAKAAEAAARGAAAYPYE